MTDASNWITRLSALSQDQLRQKPVVSAVFLFRRWRGDRIKVFT
jgi:hypothetical protein